MKYNFFQIALTSNCNFACWHCPMKDYRNTSDPSFKLTNQRLIPWLKHNLSPKNWIIELTGGEPALYEGIEELCSWLSTNNYKVLVKTNGSLPISPYNNIKRVAAFHKVEDPPKYFDNILIIDTIDSDIKVEYCLLHDIPYKIIGFNDANPDNATHGFHLCGFMDPHGHPTACKARPVHYTDPPDIYSLEFQKLKTTPCCSYCKAAIDAWRFLDDMLPK